MLDSKLVESIKSLHAAELAEFASFLDSRFFQKEFSVLQLKQFYSLILDALAPEKHTELTKETVHQAVFSPKPFAENRVDRIMFELNRLVKTFLLVKHYLREENELVQMLDWSALHRNKGIEFNFEKQFQKLKTSTQISKKASVETYFEQYLVAKEEHDWMSRFNKGKGDLGIPEAIAALDSFYLTQHFELLNRFLLQQRLTTLETPAAIHISQNLINNPQYYLDQNPALLITYKIHEILGASQPNIGDYQNLLALLKSNERYFQPEILSQFYTYLKNICILLIDEGHAEFNTILHQINQDILPKGFFYFDGKIHPNAVLSITQQAIRANDLAWAKSFLDSHKDIIIDENEARDFYMMNQALCLFADKEYEKALESIPFGSTYSAYHLMARRLELKTYYELRSEILPSKIDAFKMYINRSGSKVLSKNLAQLFTNFGNFVHQLSLSIPGDKKRSEQLIRRIQEKKLVAERSWLLEKAKEIGETRL